jgi:crotonobetaine/carnitine-CoA ligase
VDRGYTSASASDLAKAFNFSNGAAKACSVLRQGQHVPPEALLDYCQERMPYFAVPDYIEFVDTLSKTPTQKSKKHTLREISIPPSS